MSKKSKLILATALFGAALFGASCGGGGGTASAPPPPPPPPPPPGIDGRVLALLNLGTVGAGTSRPVSICELRSNNQAQCGNDLNPSEDADLEYIHEFPNGNVVLKAGGVLYFFNGSQVIKPTSYRMLGVSSETSAPGGITIPSGTVTYYATPNFVIMLITNEVVAVSKDGKVIRDSGGTYSLPNVGASCEAVTKLTVGTFKLNTDGTSTSTTIPTTLASADGKSLVRDGSNIYLSDSGCSATGVPVASISNVQDAQMVKMGNDFYIAVRHGASGDKLNYYKVTGNTLTTLRTNIDLHANNRYFYALDGMGRLYAITNISSSPHRVTVKVYSNIGGAEIGSINIDVSSAVSSAGLLGLGDRVLARVTDSSMTPTTIVSEVFITGGVVNAVPVTAPNLPTALQRCTDASNTKDIDGAGTNFIRCVWDDGTATGGERLSVIAYSEANGYASNDVRINPTSVGGGAIDRDNIRFGANAVLVVTRPQPLSTLRPIHLCTTTTTPTLSVSCSPTDIPNPVGNLPIRDTTRIYPSTDLLKFNGDNVFYLSGTSAKLRNLFSPTASSLPVTVSSASGGNASFDLTRFAFNFQPVTAPSGCNTQIVYLPSANGPEKRYTLSTANTCVKRILKVY